MRIGGNVEIDCGNYPTPIKFKVNFTNGVKDVPNSERYKIEGKKIKISRIGKSIVFL